MEQPYTIYDRHYTRMGNKPPDYAGVMRNPARYSIDAAWLPVNRSAAILDIGMGWGTLLLQLWAGGYRNLTGVDISERMVEIAATQLPSSITTMCGDASRFLHENGETYDVITMFDVVEHMTVAEARVLLDRCRHALRPGGYVVVRVPNAANILSAYSRYMDITHQVAYTEWSMMQLLESVGFVRHRVVPRPLPPLSKWLCSASLRHPLAGLCLEERLNNLLHKALYFLREQNPRPTIYWYNLLVQSWPEA